MLDIVLQILSVLGIILLVLLGLLLLVLLLVLFFPVTYRIFGEKEGKELNAAARANWLFGLLRVRYAYPNPGKLTAKILWFTVFDTGAEADDMPSQDDSKDAQNIKKQEIRIEETAKDIGGEADKHRDAQREVSRDEDPEQENAGKEDRKESSEEAWEGEKTAASEKGSWILEKVTKIKYTILGIYDKIKRIWQNISYYVELLQDEETRLLFHHVKSRLWKILRSIRPRKLKAKLLFGTGAPDTTGYAYGIYGMLLPLLGPDVIVTPDFQQAILEGSFYAAGHVTVAVLLWHGLCVLLDKRLRLFRSRLKNKGKKQVKHKVSKA